MKKVGIITINDNDNYGNRLQNYAVQETLNNNGVEAITIKNNPTLNSKKLYCLRTMKFYIHKVINKLKRRKITGRERCFEKFNKNIKFSSKTINLYSKIAQNYDLFFTGSDQVWNPNFARLREVDLLTFARPEQRIAFSASFGINELSLQYHEQVKKELLKFKAISVRENEGKKICEELTERKDIEVLVDPTMLLTVDEWDKVLKKPEMLKYDKYILNYFLGELSIDREKEIERIAKENNCEIINILDKNSPFYQTGPSEFLYLEKNAFLICTDSFHSCVFAMLYNKPFVVFERKDKNVNMSSRIETLIEKFKLKNRKFEGEISKENLNAEYTEANQILENERKKAFDFLKMALES